MDRALLGRVMLRAGFLWLLLRLIVLAFTLASGEEGALSPQLALSSSAIILGAIVGMAAADMRALRERVFLANLGVGRPAVLGMTLATAAVLELAWAVLA